MSEEFVDHSKTDLYQKLRPEVENVAFNNMNIAPEKITDVDIHNITQRICEDREEDSLDFWVYLSDIQSLTEQDDWSEVNGCIENMIEKHLKIS